MSTKRKPNDTSDDRYEATEDHQNNHQLDPTDAYDSPGRQTKRQRVETSNNSVCAAKSGEGKGDSSPEPGESSNETSSTGTTAIMTYIPLGPENGDAEAITATDKSVLSTLPAEILKQIFKHVFPVKQTIKPWYRFAMLTIGVRGFSENDEGVTFQPNVDVAVFRVNKVCHEAGTDLLYGQNHFLFTNRSDCVLWFLKLIGDRNVAKIRKVSFELNTGWLADRRDRDIVASPFENSREEDWAKSMVLLQRAGVRLEYLGVKILSWTATEDEPDYAEEDKEELNEWRKKVVDRLARFRDVEEVELEEVGSSWIGNFILRRLKLLIQQ